MACCGKARRQLSKATTPAPPVAPATGQPVTAIAESVVVRYLGPGSLTVVGSGSGRTYHFARTGDWLSVDSRDRMALRRVAHLVEVAS